MDNQHLSKYDAKMQGMYYVLDTTIDPSRTARIPAMNGRVGDKMRSVPLAFVDDGQPHDLTNTTIELRVQDSAGVVKTSNKILNLKSATGGLVIFGIPAQFYQAAGEVQHAYFVLTDKDQAGDARQVSTVNVDFEVSENGIDVTKAQSKIYLSNFDELLQEASQKADALKLQNNNIEAMIAGYTQKLNDNQIARTSVNNAFTGTNSFMTAKIQNLESPQLDDINTKLQTASSDAKYAKTNVDNANQGISNLTNQLSQLQEKVKSQASQTPDTSNFATNSSVSAVAEIASQADSNATKALATASDANASVADVQDDYETLSDAVSDATDQISTATSTANSASNAVSTITATATQAKSTADSAYSLAQQAQSTAQQALTVANSKSADPGTSTGGSSAQVLANTATLSQMNGATGPSVAAYRALAIANQLADVLDTIVINHHNDLDNSDGDVQRTLNGLDDNVPSADDIARNWQSGTYNSLLDHKLSMLNHH